MSLNIDLVPVFSDEADVRTSEKKLSSSDVDLWELISSFANYSYADHTKLSSDSYGQITRLMDIKFEFSMDIKDVVQTLYHKGFE